MTAQQFREAAARLGYGSQALSRALGVNPSSCRAWASGRKPVPPEVAQRLRDLEA